MPINSRLIAKNTGFLYLRLILILLVTLYMSRVLLVRLGAEDYGLYFVVFGVVGMVSFLNGTLSTSTSRFITFALGGNNSDHCRIIFNTTLVAHIFLAIIVVFLGETIGLWYAHHVMVVPAERWQAAMIVYQISVVSAVVSIIQVPFTSEVIAHERMNAYAIIGIFEAIAKLAIVFLLSICSADRLVFYAFLTLAVSFVVCLFYVLYSKRCFEEVIFSFEFDHESFSAILKFSGWNILANVSNTLMGQGVILLFNLFFAPVVVAAQAIGNQIFTAVSQFSWNVRNAVNPQIIKLYADQKYDESSRLTFISSELILYLTMVFCVPCILVMPTLLNIWLVEVPDYTVGFSRLFLLQLILDNYNASFYAPMLAANKISKNSIIAVVLCVIQFLALYLLFNAGFGPFWARYICIAGVFLFSFFVKPILLCKEIGYRPRTMFVTLLRGLLAILVTGIVNLGIYLLFPQDTIGQSAIVVLLSILSVLILATLFIEKNLRIRACNYVKMRLGLNRGYV